MSKTIKDHLLDATTIAMDKRVMEMHCGNALAEIERLEGKIGLIEGRVKAMVTWLETNQPDVFRRGLWDAIGDAGK